MELEKQQLLISYLVSSQELYVKVSPILQTKYFDAKAKSLVTFVKKYYEEYKAPPTLEQIKAETGQHVDIKTGLTRSEISYAENQLESFCREKAIECAVMAAPPLIVDGNYSEIERQIRDAVTVSISRNLGVDYFSDPEARLHAMSLNSKPTSTMWKKLDEYLAGGLFRKQMIIFAAPPGVGKSLTMANLAKNLMKQGLNGIYISLELSEEMVAKRFDSMFSGIQQTDLDKNITEASVKIIQQREKHGKMFIKRMPESSTNANHIRAYLKEFEIVHGFTPDFMCVDYLDLMCSVQQISAENTFARDKFISEELRSIANDFDMYMITASQLGRAAQLVENVQDIGQAHIAGGISKVNTTDNLVGIIQNPQMKARGEMMFTMLKTRSSNGVGNFFMLKFNSKTLCLENLEEDEDSQSRMTKSLSSYVSKKKDEGSSSPASLTIPSSSKKLDISNLPFQV